MNNKTRKKAARVIADVLYVIDTNDPEHPAFLDSGADSIDLLIQLKKRLKKSLVGLILATNQTDFDHREVAALLAGLRCLQQVRAECAGDLPDDLQDILDKNEGLLPLENEEIDTLCERLNMS